MRYKLEKNRNNEQLIPVIYCMNCSGGTHQNMHTGTGKGRCYIFKNELYEGKDIFTARCSTCGWESSPNNVSYFHDYEIGNEV